MVSVEQQHFRSCEVHTITGTVNDVKMVMGYLVKNRRGIVISRKFSDKSGKVIIELEK